METAPHLGLHARAWYRSLAALTLIAALFAAGVIIPLQQGAPRANPQLLQIAAQQPETTVGVVVQKLTSDRSLEDMVLRGGGLITGSLPIINGFTARLLAGAVPRLALDERVRWVSLDSPVVQHACSGAGCIDPALLASVYNQTIGATALWNRPTPLRGQGIGVAVLDSGINPQEDLYSSSGVNRIVAGMAYNGGYNQDTGDMFGHGNHIANIIGGDGSRTHGRYVGVAPNVNIINVKISDDLNQGTATTSSMLEGMQWIYDKKTTYNIRVVNISLTDSVIESYNVSPLSAAAERLWQRGIVVVVAAGNGGPNSLAAPGNDPWVITVGATNDRGTASPTDDIVASWSSYGTTVDGFAKPDLVAPGVNLVAALPVPNAYLPTKYPGNVSTDSSGVATFRMSGTSVSAPVVAGAAALLLQSQPGLTPNQVKYRLMATARSMGGAAGSGAGILNIQAAVDATTITASANGGLSYSAAIGNLTSTVGSTAKWSTAKWSTAKWSTAKWSTCRP